MRPEVTEGANLQPKSRFGRALKVTKSCRIQGFIELIGRGRFGARVGLIQGLSGLIEGLSGLT